MNASALQDALLSAKLLLVLSRAPYLSAVKANKKTISKSRSSIDLMMRVLLAQDAAAGPTTIRVEAHLASMRQTLVTALRQMPLNILILGRTARAAQPVPAATVAARAVQRKAEWNCVAQLLKALEKLESVSFDEKFGFGRGALTPPEDSAEALKDFGSLVRNSEWLPVLSALGVDLANVALVRELDAHLSITWGSRQGKTEVPQRYLRFVPAPEQTPGGLAEQSSWSDMATVMVTLDSAKLVNMPRTRELSVDFPEVAPRVVDLLMEAVRPACVRPGDTAQAVIERKLSAFQAGLEQRAAAVKAARVKAKRVADAAQKAKVLEALKALGPLAQVLKKHPELLDQV